MTYDPPEPWTIINIVDNELIVVKSENLTDWYTIELAVHEHRHWMEPTQYGVALRYSGRVSDADVEGSSYEMMEIAAAIENGTDASFRRCEASPSPDRCGYYFSSPRNSRSPAYVSLDVAKKLAADIRAKVVLERS